MPIPYRQTGADRNAARTLHAMEETALDSLPHNCLFLTLPPPPSLDPVSCICVCCALTVMLHNQAFLAVSHWIMVLQLSVLRVFQAILSDKPFRKQEGSGEVIHLATHVTRHLFARLAPDNPYEGNTNPFLMLPSSLPLAPLLMLPSILPPALLLVLPSSLPPIPLLVLPPILPPSPLAGATPHPAPRPLAGATLQLAPCPLPSACQHLPM